MFIFLGLSCHYWSEKINFIRSQIELIEKTIFQVKMVETLLDFLASQLAEGIKRFG
jgi:hypothetical protein